MKGGKIDMLLECLNGPIRVDGKPVMENLRLNVQGSKQLRTKFNWIGDGRNIPFDIVVYGFSTPALEKTNITMTVNGEEYGHHIPFYLKLSYSFFGRKIIVSGSINRKSVNYELRTLLDITTVLIPEIAKCIH